MGMTLIEGLCAMGLIWAIWKGYREGLFGVFVQWFGLIISLGLVWWLHRATWWQNWKSPGMGAEPGSWEKWGILAGILIGVQWLLMAFKALINRFFEAIGLGIAYRWGGALMELMKWVVILSLIFHLVAQAPRGLAIIRSAFPWSADWWLGIGEIIWAIGSSRS
jgi:hypothetical protein